MLQITLLLGLATGTLAQITALGSCPSVTVVTDFDVNRFMGKWYEAEKYFAMFELGGKCVTLNYSLNNNNTITVLAGGINPTLGIEAPITGLATFSGNVSEAKLTVNYPSPPILIDAPYWIIGTDYVNWAVIWSCKDLGFYGVRYAWLLTREQDPSRETMEAAYAVFKKNRLSQLYLLKTDQTNC